MRCFTYLEKRALAKASRILQPPENVLVARACISGVNPKPLSMIDARAGALSASMFSNWAYTSVSSEDKFGSVDLKIYYTSVILKLILRKDLLLKTISNYSSLESMTCLGFLYRVIPCLFLYTFYS